MEIANLFQHFKDELEDFWGRRTDGSSHRRDFRIFGRAVRLFSNEATLLKAVDYTVPLYSRLPATEHAPYEIQMVAQPARITPGPVPENLMNAIWYGGQGDWLMIQLGGWGACFVDLAGGRAVAVLAPELARRPELVSRCLLNTIVLNFCLASGYGMLHASCLFRDGRALLLVAPHNAGKSTSALRLALAGYTLVADSMIHVSPYHRELRLAGFPVGTVKLRRDVLHHFPQLKALLATEQVRNETKYRVDLRHLDHGLVLQDAVVPEHVELCLLSRSADAVTRLGPATEDEVWQAIMGNSLYLDKIEIWQKNLEQLRRCVDAAGWHHLSVGLDPEGLVAAVSQLWEA